METQSSTGPPDLISMRKSQDLVAKSCQEKNPPTTGPVLALRTDLDEMLQQHTQDLMDELRSGAQKTP